MENGTSFHLALLKKISNRSPCRYRTRMQNRRFDIVQKNTTLEPLNNLKETDVIAPVQKILFKPFFNFNDTNGISAWSTDNTIDQQNAYLNGNKPQIYPHHFTKQKTQCKPRQKLKKKIISFRSSKENINEKPSLSFYNKQDNEQFEFVEYLSKKVSHSGSKKKISKSYKNAHTVNITYGQNQMKFKQTKITPLSLLHETVSKAFFLKGGKICSFYNFMQELNQKQKSKRNTDRSLH